MKKEDRNYKNHKWLFELTVIYLLISGCGDDNNNNKNSELNTIEQSVKLAGNVWLTQQCEKGNVATEYHRLVYEFTLDNSIKVGRQYYEDSDCIVKIERFLPSDVDWLYTESGPVILEDGIQGKMISFDIAGEIINGYYVISALSTLCFSYNLALAQNEIGLIDSNTIDYDHCLTPENMNESEENDTMKNQEDIIKDYLKETGWTMETTKIRPASYLNIPNCSFYSVIDSATTSHISSTIGITVNDEIIAIHDPNVVKKILSVNSEISSLSAGSWAELFVRFAFNIHIGHIFYELPAPYIDKFKQAGVEFVPPELEVNGNDFSVHYFLETYETSVAREVLVEIKNGLIHQVNDQFIAER